MDVLLTSFSAEVVKIAAEKSEHRSYPAAMVAAAPVALAQSVSDVPRGAVDKSVERVVMGKRPGLKAAITKGVSRGGGRLGAALITTPAFMGGIKKIRDAKTKKQRREGMAQVLGSGAAFSAIKGGIEAAGGREMARAQHLSKIKSLASSRGISGIIASGLLASSIAEGLKTPKRVKGKKPGTNSKWKRYGKPAAVGAAIGGAKGAWDAAYEIGIKGLKKPRALRRVGASAAGRGAAGVVGAVALSEIMRKALKPKIKTAAMMPPGHQRVQDEEKFWGSNPSASDVRSRYRRMNVNFGPKPRDIYDKVALWSKERSEAEVYAAYQQLRDGKPEASPPRRAAHYALVDNLTGRGHPVPEPPMRRNVQGKVKAPTTVDTLAMAAVIAAPTAAFYALSSMEPADKDRVLREAMDRLIASKNIAVIDSDAKEFVTNMFDPETGKIHLHKGAPAEAAAHELGHARAKGLRKAVLQSGLSRQALYTGRVLSVAVPLLALEGMNDGSFAAPQELEARAKFMQRVGVLAGALQAPALAEEVAASVKGMKYLRRAGNLSNRAVFRRGARTMLPAFLTHAAPAAAPFVAARLLRRRAERGKR